MDTRSFGKVSFVLSIVLILVCRVQSCGVISEDYFGNLNKISFIGCNLDTVPSDIPESIIRVILNDNFLTNLTLPPSLDHIYELKAANNRLHTFPNVTASRRRISVLSFNNNYIRSIDPDLLIPLVKLWVLYMKGNQLTSLPDVSIVSTRFNHLTVSFNNFTEFPNLVYLGTNIISLDISGNGIKSLEISDNSVLPQIEKLSLTDNLILDYSNVSYIGDTLKMFNISGMTFGKSLKTIVESFDVIITLEMNRCQLQNFPDLSSTGETLTNLYLEENLISNIPRLLLEPLISLQKLHLNRNKLTKLPDFSPLYKTLTDLVLEGNEKIEVADAEVADMFDGIGTNQPGLLLDLRNVPISRVPASLCENSNTTLRKLMLRGASLVCDCKLRWLKVATLAGLDTDLGAGTLACKGGPPEMLNSRWGDIELSDLKCKDLSRGFLVEPITFTCLGMSVQEETTDGPETLVSCSDACAQHPSCFMFRFSRKSENGGMCTLIGQGKNQLVNLKNLYKLI